MPTTEYLAFLGSATIGAASVTGPLHQRQSLPNQDAFACFYSGSMLILAVADGLGSAPKSQVGSRCAVDIAVQVLLEGLRTEDVSIASIKHEILSRWLKHCTPDPRDYDTTLLLVGLTPRQCLFGQIGDGLIVYKSTDEALHCHVFDQRDKRFLSEPPSSLAQPTAFNDFRIEDVTNTLGRQPAAIFLMTDGITDDLRDVEAYTNSLLENLEEHTAQNWGKALEEHLDHWPTPGHYDDKTLIVTRWPFGGKSPATIPEIQAGTSEVSGQTETSGVSA